ncbi:ssk1 response regulator receiver, partial [Ceratobasidium sp. 423]
PQSVLPAYSGLSLELADTAQLIIQTLLQLSPPHLLDPAKEQFSGCTLQLPTTSVGGMLHAMKGLNWMSIRLAGFVESERNADLDSVLEESKEENFDIGELLQAVGDLLGGIAAQAGVDLVIYHADVGLKHVGVKGDEGGISYALSHIVRQVMATAEPGETIELGLSLDQHDSKVNCIFDITHRMNTPVDTRILPQLDTVILRRLLTHIHATLRIKPSAVPSSPSLVATPDTPTTPITHTATTQTYTLTVPLNIAPLLPPILTPAEQAERQPFPTLKLANEPTLEELAKFQEKVLRGKKATFYANPKSSFARHLTSYLTAWGVGIEHRAMDEDPSTGEGEDKSSFIIIDDDVSVLRARLNQLHTPYYPATPPRKRPSLAANHRPKSSSHIRQLAGIPEASHPVVVHFTSLGNYKVVRDVVQSILWTQTSLEVLVIPKPAGPRRFLTALHTALTRPLVDPVFAPIATSPTSPSPISLVPRHKAWSPVSTRPSPLAIESSREYFSETAEMLESAVSPGVGVGVETSGGGIVVQNIDGTPKGIFFDPRQRSGSGGPGGRASTLDTSSSTKRPNIELKRSGTIDSFDQEREHSPAYQDTNSPRKSPTSPITPAPVIVKSPRMTPPAFTRSKSGNRVPKVRQNSANGEKEGKRRGSNGGPGEVKSPAAGAKSPTVGAAAAKKPAKKGKDAGIVPPISVLIVEDNPINQTILSTFIKRKKIKCEVAQNGLQAVEKWKTGRFHLIFMDIQMPVMDGIDATREIRRLEKIQHGPASTPPIESPSLLSESKQLFTPSSDSKPFGSSGPSSPFRSSVVIVALTASSLQSDRVAALAAGCNDFLTKPVALDWLDKKIIEWGSIKALQMWADPEMARNFQRGQEAKAKAVASHLRIEKKSKSTDSSTSAKGPEIHIQAPTPPIQTGSKPPISRRITKSPSPLSRSMVLPSEPPPLSTLKFGDAIVPTSRQEHGKAAGDESVSEGEGKPTEIGKTSDQAPKAPEDIPDVPELSLDAPPVAVELPHTESPASGSATPRPTHPLGTDTPHAPASAPPPTSELSPPRETAASPMSPDLSHTDTPYQSATSNPPSPS